MRVSPLYALTQPLGAVIFALHAAALDGRDAYGRAESFGATRFIRWRNCGAGWCSRIVLERSCRNSPTSEERPLQHRSIARTGLVWRRLARERFAAKDAG